MTAFTMQRQASDLTVTDIFCGAGGNTIGAKKAGLRVRVGLNHWQRAIDTYGTNNPEVEVIERVDVSLCDPRRYPSTDIGIFSPECTTHSPAGGSRHRAQGPTLFDSGKPLDPATVRSRVTMFDVVRFTEYHRYRLVIVENVVEATRWELFPDWLRMMDHLGYRHRILSINSMFHHPTPQSRDRIYIVFWQAGNRAPELDHRPVAPCRRCGNVEAVQSWKNRRTVGKYGRQYLFACPNCSAEVRPFYFAALNAIDFTLSAERIGDRSKPLKPRTMERIEFGLRKYGNRRLIVKCSSTSGTECRVLDAGADAMPTQATFVHHGIVGPGFLMDITHAGGKGPQPRSLDDAAATQTCQQSSALVMLASAGGRETVASGTDPMPAQLASERLGVVQGAALMTMRASNDGYPLRGMDDALAAQVASCSQDALISRQPFIVSYYGQDQASAADDAVPTVTVKERHGLVTPADELTAEECFFRMLQPHEIGAAMAFPADYLVGGNKRDRVKQYGNAVTPPVMDWIVRQCAATLAPELAQDGGA